MYNNICIIGLGTLGGYLSYNLKNLEIVKKLTLFDYDTVEVENIKNSIYTSQDLGLLKTEAIRKKLGDTENIIIRNEKFIEEQTNLFDCDLVIDCRDFTYDRKNIIDVRLYISLRTLVIDCRKNIINDLHHEGKYIERLTKTDINNAAMNVSVFIANGLMKDLVDNQVVHQIKLDYCSKMTKQLILQNKNNKNDLVYDFNQFDKKLLNLHENYASIIETNTHHDITIYVGSKKSPFITKTIPAFGFKTINDIILECSFVMKGLPYPFNSYVLSLLNENQKYYIELLPETGSA